MIKSFASIVIQNMTVLMFDTWNLIVYSYYLPILNNYYLKVNANGYRLFAFIVFMCHNFSFLYAYLYLVFAVNSKWIKRNKIILRKVTAILIFRRSKFRIPSYQIWVELIFTNDSLSTDALWMRIIKIDYIKLYMVYSETVII